MDATPHELPDYPARARALAPLITPLARDIDEQRGLPRNVVDRLIGDGFFRLLQPKSLGGAELHPVEFTKTTETLAAMDASVGWCVCQNNGCSMTTAYLSEAAAQEIFGPDTGILAWGPPGAPFEAVKVDGGYRISGTWRFASGSQNATWLGAHMRIAGTNTVRTMIFPKTSVRMVDIWHTLGLRGTASNEYVAEDLFVPDHHTCSRDNPAERREQGLLYRFTSNQLYSVGFAGVGMGIARGMIDAFLSLPVEKVSRGASKPMRENNVVQSQLAQSVARLRSARANLHNTWHEAWEHVVATGEQTMEDRTMTRLASTWAITQAREVVNTLYHAAGSIAIFEEQPFERRMRDIHTVAQQSQGRQLHFETVGQILLGVATENQF
jgi:alkylation response protein AidB-like acyl-CoA dehydrogenase